MALFFGPIDSKIVWPSSAWSAREGAGPELAEAGIGGHLSASTYQCGKILLRFDLIYIFS